MPGEQNEHPSQGLDDIRDGAGTPMMDRALRHPAPTELERRLAWLEDQVNEIRAQDGAQLAPGQEPEENSPEELAVWRERLEYARYAHTGRTYKDNPKPQVEERDKWMGRLHPRRPQPTPTPEHEQRMARMKDLLETAMEERKERLNRLRPSPPHSAFIQDPDGVTWEVGQPIRIEDQPDSAPELGANGTRGIPEIADALQAARETGIRNGGMGGIIEALAWVMGEESEALAKVVALDRLFEPQPDAAKASWPTPAWWDLPAMTSATFQGKTGDPVPVSWEGPELAPAEARSIQDIREGLAHLRYRLDVITKANNERPCHIFRQAITSIKAKIKALEWVLNPLSGKTP